MTANKHFKRRVRDRARRTGESYTAALRHLRRDPEERPVGWQRIEKAAFGYAVQVPEGWVEHPPNLKNSPFETARFIDPADRRHSVTVFRGMPQPGVSALQVAEQIQVTLEASGFGDVRIAVAEVAGQSGARLDCAKHDAGRVWAVREYIAVRGPDRFILGCASAAPDEDDPLFTAIADRFEILNPGG